MCIYQVWNFAYFHTYPYLSMFSIRYSWVQGIPPISIDVSNKSHMGPTMWFSWFLTPPIKRRKKKGHFQSFSSKCGYREWMVWWCTVHRYSIPPMVFGVTKSNNTQLQTHLQTRHLKSSGTFHSIYTVDFERCMSNKKKKAMWNTKPFPFLPLHECVKTPLLR